LCDNKLPTLSRSQFPADISGDLICIDRFLHGGFDRFGGASMTEKVQHHRAG
jgi:hypothetical protein